MSRGTRCVRSKVQEPEVEMEMEMAGMSRSACFKSHEDSSETEMSYLQVTKAVCILYLQRG